MRQVGNLAKDFMANSTASIIIKPTAALYLSDSFIFDS
jgi:hypothetical protein